MIFCEAEPIQNADIPEVPAAFRGKKSAHLMADSRQELLDYVIKIGLKPKWIQAEGMWNEHFDIVGRVLKQVMKDPRVTKLSWEEILDKLRRRKQQL